jgi:hypothetical protein
VRDREQQRRVQPPVVGRKPAVVAQGERDHRPIPIRNRDLKGRPLRATLAVSFSLAVGYI